MKISPQRIGIYGGMFDPIHIGHLRLAIEGRELLKLDEVRLLPCANPAHRGGAFFSAGKRLKMVQLAITNIQGLIADDYEIISAAQNNNPSWTINTLKYMRDTYPTACLFLLLGSDSFANFMHWKKWDEFLNLCNLVVISRPNCPSYNLNIQQFIAEHKDFYWQANNNLNGKIIELNHIPLLDVSSSQIREYLQQKRSTCFLIPQAVREFIAKSK